MGVLGHQVGPSFAPVGCLSKTLDPRVKGWKPCLWVLASAAVLIQESKKTCFRITAYHSFFTSPIRTPNLQGLQSLLPSHILAHQMALTEDPILIFKSCPLLNPATLLHLLPPSPNHMAPIHSCIETIKHSLPHPSNIPEGLLIYSILIYRWQLHLS